MLSRLVMVSVIVLSLGSCRNDKAMDEAIDSSAPVVVEETVDMDTDTEETDMDIDAEDIDETAVDNNSDDTEMVDEEVETEEE